MSSQALDLHRALLRPFVIHTLRSAGFHNTKPSVLDTLLNLTERFLLLLATTTAQHAWSAHNDPHPTLSDVREALQDCGVLTPLESGAQQQWTEIMRADDDQLAAGSGGAQRVVAEKRKREEEDLADVRAFLRWFDGTQYGEIKRVAGLVAEPAGGSHAAGTGPDGAGGGGIAVGVGGGVVQVDDFLTALKKKHGKAGDDAKWRGTVLGLQAEDKAVFVEGGPVQNIRDWRPRVELRVDDDVMQEAHSDEGGSALSSPPLDPTVEGMTID